MERATRNSGTSWSMDKDFEGVIRQCADRPNSWIDERLIASYIDLYRAGYAHSVETWLDGRLVGGVYGVSIGSAFFGESMFSLISNAGKSAFYELLRRMRRAGYTLFDTQYINDHTASLGAIEITRAEFRRHLRVALMVQVELEHDE